MVYDILTVQADWGSSTSRPVPRMCRRVISQCFSEPENAIDLDFWAISKRLHSIFCDADFNKVLDLLQYTADHRDDRNNLADAIELNRRLERFPSQINEVFERHRAAYLFDTSKSPYRILPRISEAQGVAVQNAVAALKGHSQLGAVTHLSNAANHLDAGEYPDAIVDSILAVESVARLIDPQASKTLTPALKSLERQEILKHPALVESLEKLYGYTSDEQGLRHALLAQEAADVGMNEAMLMFGTCASFAAYLANVSQQFGIGGDNS